MMREIRTVTLCTIAVMCLSLTSATSGACFGEDATSGWGTAVLLETDDSGDAWPPQVAVDDSGNATVVWCQRDDTRFNVWSNRYIIGMGWNSPTLIETNNSGGAADPQVAVDGSGNAIAVWSQSDDVSNNIWSNRYVVGLGWGTATLIETNDSGPASNPQVAVDDSGNAIAVWQQSDNIHYTNHYSIWSNRYIVGTGWGTATTIGTSEWGDCVDAQVAVDDSGNATAVWEQSYLDGPIHIWSIRYVVGEGWGTAAPIETDTLGFSFRPQVATDHLGNAIAVWDRYDGFGKNVWSNRYVVGTGWEFAALIETGVSGESKYPQVAVDDSGNAVAVWIQAGATCTNVWSSRYTHGTGWDSGALIETDDSGNAVNPQVAVHGSGNAVAVWSQFDGTRLNICSNRFAIGAGWEGATLIETDDSGFAGMCPQVAVDDAGNAIAVWSQSDGTRVSIWSNRYVGPDPTPESDSMPSSLTIAAASLVTIAIVVVIILFWLRSKGADRSGRSNEDEEPPRSNDV